MKLAMVEKSKHIEPLTAREWMDIQRTQFEHDEKYHREISRLTVQDRMKHMTLHFAKYAGKLAAGLDDSAYRIVLADIFIIAISSANILNIKLSEKLDHHDLDINLRGELAKTVAVIAGKMAATCEKLDHLEAVAFREDLTEGILDMVATALAHIRELGEIPQDLVAARLRPIKSKSIFHETK